MLKHLYIIYFSEANCSSKSNNSNIGLGKSFTIGSKTASCKGGRGVSNCGGIIANVSCFKFSFEYNSITSGTKWLSILNIVISNKSIKFFGGSFMSSKQLFVFSDSDIILGI